MTRWFRPAIAVLAFVKASYMALDGSRALIVGDYLTPPSHQLGTWSAVVSAVGIAPRSPLRKGIFATYGLAWLASIAAYLAGARWAWPAILVAAVFSLRYLPVGTAISLLVIAGASAARLARLGFRPAVEGPQGASRFPVTGWRWVPGWRDSWSGCPAG